MIVSEYNPLSMPLAEMAAAVAGGRITALALAEAALAAIAARNPAINAVTRVLADRARATASATDAAVARAEAVGPLAGVPFAVKDLFDLAGLPTTEGAAMLADAPPARADAEAVRRLVAAGATPVATCNMDAHAYGFATINAHHGATRNPHDRARLAGGSSGGSAAAVAAGMVPLALGTDTNGSIRVPAALCGLYGLKPTHGALPMAGVAAFVDSFDDIGPMAARLSDLALAYEVLAGDAMGPVAGPLRAARLGGWFASDIAPEMAEAMAQVATALDLPVVELPRVDAARSAAFVMTATEGAALHLPRLRTRAMEYDPQVRDRLLAGTLVPHAAYAEAQAFRAWFGARAAELFTRFDVLIAPSTPFPAPRIDDPMIEIGGRRVPARAHLGIYTQPISFIGLPVLAVPLRVAAGRLPLGLQLIGAPGGEASLFAFARRLDEIGLTAGMMADLAGAATHKGAHG